MLPRFYGAVQALRNVGPGPTSAAMALISRAAQAPLACAGVVLGVPADSAAVAADDNKDKAARLAKQDDKSCPSADSRPGRRCYWHLRPGQLSRAAAEDNSGERGGFGCSPTSARTGTRRPENFAKELDKLVTAPRRQRLHEFQADSSGKATRNLRRPRKTWLG